MTSHTPQIARSKPANFIWEDPFLLEDQLTEEERLVRDTAQSYAQEKLMDNISGFAHIHIYYSGPKDKISVGIIGVNNLDLKKYRDDLIKAFTEKLDERIENG